MKFFTDKSVINPYLLIKIKDYLRVKDFSQWHEVFIDPGVYELKKSEQYSWENDINVHEFLETLPQNHYFACDYPSDMNLKFQDKFIFKSFENAQKYGGNSHYIAVVQYKFHDYWDFKYWFDLYNNLPLESNILGLGNACRIIKKNDPFLLHALPYAFKNCKYERIHVYGLSLHYIPLAYKLSKKYNVQLSTDSTKWTRACSTRLRNKYYPKTNCVKSNRQEFFEEYKTVLMNYGVELMPFVKIALQNDYI